MTVMSYVIAVPVAIVVSLIFFGGLWLTVNRLPQTPHPGRWMLLSSVIRFTCAGSMFYALARYAGIGPLLSALAIFIVTRFVLVRWLPGKQFGDSQQGENVKL